MSLQVLTAPVRVNLFLPFLGGDPVLVRPSRARGEGRGWTVTGRRLGVEVVCRVYLAGAPAGEDLEVDVRDLAPQLRM